jgi:hypothetical protein
MNVKEIFLKKAKLNELSPFYILEPALITVDSQNDLFLFISDFLSSYFKSFNPKTDYSKNIFDCPDVYVFGENNGTNAQIKNSDYLVSDFQKMNEFLQYKSLITSKKFIIIPDAQKLNLLLSNKLLKTLEEPPLSTSIFLLNPFKQKLLDTLHSRAIHFRIPSSIKKVDHLEWKEFLDFVKNHPLHEFIEKNIKNEKNILYWTEHLIQWESAQYDHPESKNELINWLKNLEEMTQFNQPAATKWSLFYNHLSQHVLPRLRD